jgi:hypothetical protein
VRRTFGVGMWHGHLENRQHESLEVELQALILRSVPLRSPLPTGSISQRWVKR